MKKIKLPLSAIVLAILFLYSCQEQKPIKTKMNEKHTICYTAIDKADTAWLKLDTAEKNILGEMEFRYANKNHYQGPVKAIMKGDTLRGNFSFKLNNVDKWYKNPIALLKKDKTLTLGIGEIMTLWGSGYFDKNTPIDYNKGRFVFKRSGCLINP